ALESRQSAMNIAESQNRIAGLDKQIQAEKAVIAATKDDAKAKAENATAQNKLVILQDEQTKEAISLEEALANERIANIKNVLAAAQEAIAVGNREADFQRTIIAGRGELVDLLIVGERQIDQFNRKLDQNSETFRV